MPKVKTRKSVRESSAPKARASKKRRGNDLDYPFKNGFFGCPDSTCAKHFEYSFGSKNTAYAHFARHSKSAFLPSIDISLMSFIAFAIIYRWNSEISDSDASPIAPTDANSCFSRLIALELRNRGITPWLDKFSLTALSSWPLSMDVKNALTDADEIIMCFAPGDLVRCAENSEDFFGFELQIALRLGNKGKPIHVLMHDVSVETLLEKQIVTGMNKRFNGLGSRLKSWLESHRRYHVDLGVPDDNWSQIMDSIAGGKFKFRSKRCMRERVET